MSVANNPSDDDLRIAINGASSVLADVGRAGESARARFETGMAGDRGQVQSAIDSIFASAATAKTKAGEARNMILTGLAPPSPPAAPSLPPPPPPPPPFPGR